MVLCSLIKIRAIAALVREGTKSEPQNSKNNQLLPMFNKAQSRNTRAFYSGKADVAFIVSLLVQLNSQNVLSQYSVTPW